MLGIPDMSELNLANSMLRGMVAWSAVSELITLIMSGKEADERKRDRSGARSDAWRLEADLVN